jgi:hypothetical protein
MLCEDSVVSVDETEYCQNGPPLDSSEDVMSENSAALDLSLDESVEDDEDDQNRVELPAIERRSQRTPKPSALALNYIANMTTVANHQVASQIATMSDDTSSSASKNLANDSTSDTSPPLRDEDNNAVTPQLIFPELEMKYIRMRSGKYNGKIGRVSLRTGSGQHYSVTLVNRIGDTTYRHTTIAQCNGEDLVDATEEEMEDINFDKSRIRPLLPPATAATVEAISLTPTSPRVSGADTASMPRITRGNMFAC